LGWEIILLLIFSSLTFLIMTGIPVALAFMIVVMVGNLILMGPSGPHQLIMSIYTSVSNFSLAPVPLFILMGDLLLRSGLAFKCINALAKWMGAIPARMSILSITGGALFGAISGSTMASTAVLGQLLLPEMDKQGYSKTLSMGAIMTSGGLAMIIPPSALAVVFAAIAELSVAKVLLAGFIPGIVLALGYMVVAWIMVAVRPESAPKSEVQSIPMGERMKSLFTDILPVTSIVAAMVVVIYAGICTPTEAASVGFVGALLLTVAYRKFTWKLIFESTMSTIVTTAMTFFIVCYSTGFSYLIAFSGASTGLLEWVTQLNIAPMAMMAAMLFLVVILGCFMDQIAIMMITLPIYMPIVKTLGFDTIWFAMLMLICLGLGLKTPPFGLNLFIMKSIAPKTTTMQLYSSVTPYIVSDLVCIALFMAFPAIILILPNLM
jgi:tripartite ATP-independent transporter DctM subunit